MQKVTNKKFWRIGDWRQHRVPWHMRSKVIFKFCEWMQHREMYTDKYWRTLLQTPKRKKKKRREKKNAAYFVSDTRAWNSCCSQMCNARQSLTKFRKGKCWLLIAMKEISPQIKRSCRMLYCLPTATSALAKPAHTYGIREHRLSLCCYTFKLFRRGIALLSAQSKRKERRWQDNVSTNRPKQLTSYFWSPCSVHWMHFKGPPVAKI